MSKKIRADIAVFFTVPADEATVEHFAKTEEMTPEHREAVRKAVEELQAVLDQYAPHLDCCLDIPEKSESFITDRAPIAEILRKSRASQF